MASDSDQITVGTDDATDGSPMELLSETLDSGVDDAYDGFSTGEEGPTPYAFIM